MLQVSSGLFLSVEPCSTSAFTDAVSFYPLCSIEQLNMSWCFFNNNHVKSVVNNLSSSVTHLNLGGYRETLTLDGKPNHFTDSVQQGSLPPYVALGGWMAPLSQTPAEEESNLKCRAGPHRTKNGRDACFCWYQSSGWIWTIWIEFSEQFLYLEARIITTPPPHPVSVAFVCLKMWDVFFTDVKVLVRRCPHIQTLDLR